MASTALTAVITHTENIHIAISCPSHLLASTNYHHLLSNGTALRWVQQKPKCSTPDSTRHVVTLRCHGYTSCLRSSESCCDAHSSDTHLYIIVTLEMTASP